jgi:hypothetical protein
VWSFVICRLVDIAPHYYDLSNFPQCEAKRVLEKLYKKREKEKDEARSRKWRKPYRTSFAFGLEFDVSSPASWHHNIVMGMLTILLRYLPLKDMIVSNFSERISRVPCTIRVVTYFIFLDIVLLYLTALFIEFKFVFGDATVIFSNIKNEASREYKILLWSNFNLDCFILILWMSSFEHVVLFAALPS